MNKITGFIFGIIMFVALNCTENKENTNYKGNPAPLKQNAYIRLPLGAIKPEGWLKSQLEAQASGLTGNMDDFWPDLVNSSWMRNGRGSLGKRSLLP